MGLNVKMFTANFLPTSDGSPDSEKERRFTQKLREAGFLPDPEQKGGGDCGG